MKQPPDLGKHKSHGIIYSFQQISPDAILSEKFSGAITVDIIFNHSGISDAKFECISFIRKPQFKTSHSSFSSTTESNETIALSFPKVYL